MYYLIDLISSYEHSKDKMLSSIITRFNYWPATIDRKMELMLYFDYYYRNPFTWILPTKKTQEILEKLDEEYNHIYIKSFIQKCSNILK